MKKQTRIEMDRFDSLQKIVDQLEFADYKNEQGGSIKMNVAFMKLKEMAKSDYIFSDETIENYEKRSNSYNVWLEGYQTTGNSSPAKHLGMFEGKTFREACKNAITELNYVKDSYNERENSYWGCRFFDNEMEAKKVFG